MQVKVSPLHPRTNQPIYALDASPDGRMLAIGQQSDPAGNAYLTLWDLATLEQVREVESGLVEMIHSARFSPDNTALAYVRNDMHVHLYDLDQQESDILPTEDGEVYQVSYAFNRNTFVASGSSIEVWDGERRDSLWTLIGQGAERQPHELTLLGALNPDATRIAVIGEQAGEAVIYDLSSKSVAQRLPGAPTRARSLAFDPFGRYLAAIEANSNGIIIWDTRSGEPHLPQIFNMQARDYCSLAFHPDGEHAALGMLGDYVLIISLKDGSFVFDKQVHRGQVWDLSFTRDGQRLISGGHDGVAYLYELS
ncbi:MAG TPA: WD40 repeat domain-containing protein [Pyrinomonadaceae bacterium]|nr:WD40 repeat domain-containing protein [Pyrinomonadaceae bacterium]